VNELLLKVLPAAGGSFIEWYEFAVYGFLEAYISSNFFEGHGGSLSTWAGFAMTFLFRPLGGGLFGYLADTVGRKLALQWTIMLMLISTIGQGCLPTFHCCGEGSGWFGMLMLLVLRAIQGLSAGGELSTAAVYISEVAPREKLGFALSFISSSGAFGAFAVAAGLVTFMESVLSPQQMMDWGWRVPFLISAVPGAVLILSRGSLHETDDFEAMLAAAVEQKSDQKGAQLEDGSLGSNSVTEGANVAAVDLSPVREIFFKHPLALLIGSLGTAAIGAFWYVPPFLGPSLVKKYTGVQASAVTGSEVVAYAIPTVLAPFVGLLVDKWGAGKLYFVALLACAIATVPLFSWWAHADLSGAYNALYGGEIVVGLVQALTSCVYLWTVELFPVRVRTTGVSLAYNLGVGIFGGLGPLLSSAADNVIDPQGPISAPALYTVVCALLSLLIVIFSQVLSRKGMIQLTHIRPVPY
jgi:MHS family proline/betaine transporter-like MFS transporter